MAILYHISPKNAIAFVVFSVSQRNGFVQVPMLRASSLVFVKRSIQTRTACMGCLSTFPNAAVHIESHILRYAPTATDHTNADQTSPVHLSPYNRLLFPHGPPVAFFGENCGFSNKKIRNRKKSQRMGGYDVYFSTFSPKRNRQNPLLFLLYRGIILPRDRGRIHGILCFCIRSQ